MSDNLRSYIISIIATSTRRLTPAQIFERLEKSISRRVFMKTIHQMVNDEQIMFTYELGTAFVRLSYNKPVKISERIVLTPSNRSIQKVAQNSTIVIKLTSGFSFGDGQHPTTILILQQLDALFCNSSTINIHKALDIGTGTGILAIAAAKLGAQSVLATDRDRIAVYEAQNNIDMNQLGDRIQVRHSDKFPEDDVFQLIIANLRLPTLCSFAEDFYHNLGMPGFCVCSGYTEEESERLLKTFEQNQFTCINHMHLNKWDCATFAKSK